MEREDKKMIKLIIFIGLVLFFFKFSENPFDGIRFDNEN